MKYCFLLCIFVFGGCFSWTRHDSYYDFKKEDKKHAIVIKEESGNMYLSFPKGVVVDVQKKWINKYTQKTGSAFIGTVKHETSKGKSTFSKTVRGICATPIALAIMLPVDLFSLMSNLFTLPEGIFKKSSEYINVSLSGNAFDFEYFAIKRNAAHPSFTGFKEVSDQRNIKFVDCEFIIKFLNNRTYSLNLEEKDDKLYFKKIPELLDEFEIQTFAIAIFKNSNEKVCEFNICLEPGYFEKIIKHQKQKEREKIRQRHEEEERKRIEEERREREAERIRQQKQKEQELLDLVKSGQKNANFNLAVFYYQAGEKHKALTYFKESARRGNSKAMYRIALIYDENKDYSQRDYWLEQAAKNGLQEAKDKIRSIAYERKRVAERRAYLAVQEAKKDIKEKIKTSIIRNSDKLGKSILRDIHATARFYYTSVSRFNFENFMFLKSFYLDIEWRGGFLGKPHRTGYWIYLDRKGRIVKTEKDYCSHPFPCHAWKLVAAYAADKILQDYDYGDGKTFTAMVIESMVYKSFKSYGLSGMQAKFISSIIKNSYKGEEDRFYQALGEDLIVEKIKEKQQRTGEALETIMIVREIIQSINKSK